MTNGLERLALAYGWPPDVGRAMDPAEFSEWTRRAEAVLKARAGATPR